MKYLKLFENIRTLRSEFETKDFDTDKLYLYQYKEWEEDDNYNFIVGLISKHKVGIVISGYHVNDKDEGEEEAKLLRGNWFPGVYDANEEEIEKYNMYKNLEKYNI